MTREITGAVSAETLNEGPIDPLALPPGELSTPEAVAPRPNPWNPLGSPDEMAFEGPGYAYSFPPDTYPNRMISPGFRALGSRTEIVGVGLVVNDLGAALLLAQGQHVPEPPDRLGTGEVLPAHKNPASNHVAQLLSPNGRAQLVFQSDGNLVLYSGAQVLWNSKTMGRGAVSAKIQPDGNFVLSNAAGAPIWASGTNAPNRGDVFLRLQDDGNLVLYLGAQALWSTQSNGFVNRQDAPRAPAPAPPPAPPAPRPGVASTLPLDQQLTIAMAQLASLPAGSPQWIALSSQAADLGRRLAAQAQAQAAIPTGFALPPPPRPGESPPPRPMGPMLEALSLGQWVAFYTSAA
jgi:hypothetical protein